MFKRHICVEHWQNALKQGPAAARNMLGENEPYDEIPWFWSDQYEHNLQYAGYHTEWDELRDGREDYVLSVVRSG